MITEQRYIYSLSENANSLETCMYWVNPLDIGMYCDNVRTVMFHLSCIFSESERRLIRWKELKSEQNSKDAKRRVLAISV